MKALLIFDRYIDREELKKEIISLRQRHVSVFPLTSQWQCIYDVEKILRANKDLEVELIGTAELIDREVDVLRDRLPKWSAELGEYKVEGHSIKQNFLLPGGEVSTWWFSLLSEKNPLKTNVFLDAAQTGAIDKIMTSSNFDLCIISIHKKNFLLAVKALCRRHSVSMRYVPQRRKKCTIKEHIKSLFERAPLVNYILRAFMCLCISIIRAVKAKLTMASQYVRLKRIDNSVIFISYFPLIDRDSAMKGELRNKYAIPLQEKLAQIKKKIIWVWMYVPLDGHSFSDALKLAKRFARNGEINFFLDEFMSIKSLAKSLLQWFHQIRIFIALNRKIPDRELYKNLCIPEAAVFIRDLMADSFVGWEGLEGILYFELYKNLFCNFLTSSYCIYFSEMQAWEKALNAAKRLNIPKIKTIGFQHTVVSRNYFQYFCHPSETVQREQSLSLPLPDILACNGDISLSLMMRSGYPDIRKVEAIRHLYLNNYINSIEFFKKEKILLIAGSVSGQETAALISLFYEAFPEPKGFKVWLKSHPYLSFEKILKKSGVPYEDSGYMIKDDSIMELLKAARVVLVGSSSVALEALALGCKVILPVFSDVMFLSPLCESDKFCAKVYNPRELRQVVYRIMAEEKNTKKDMLDIKTFISNYWCLDKSLKRWEDILN